MDVARSPSVTARSSQRDGSNLSIEGWPKEVRTKADVDGLRPLAGVGNIKWNPGHYIKFASDSTDAEIDARLREVRSLPFVKGIFVKNFWRQLEPRRGVYDFRRIDRHLNKAAVQGKRYFLQLSTRHFKTDRVAPDYLRTPQFDGGVYQFQGQSGNVGESIALWDENVRYRLALLIRELARRYDSHPNFEGIVLNETAFGQPVEPISEEKRTAFYSNLIRIDTIARQAFTRTVVIQYINFPQTRTGPIVQNMLNRGIGFGAPDVFVEDEEHNEAVYPYNDLVQGKIPIGMQVEAHCFIRRCIDCPFDPPPVREIYAFARHRLHSNYVFWQYLQEDYYNAWDRLLAMFRSPTFPNDPAGGLATQCPSQYASCIRD